jgi:histidine ammonia-lyase
VRPHPGQVGVAKRLRMLLSESELLDTAGQVQDAYSLRCTPQIIGPAWDILAFAKNVASRELNSATDNPLLFGEEALSGGNFHGQVIGLAADYLKIALANVGGLSERRTFRLSAEHTNAGLPPMLVAKAKDAGLHSGLMMLQYSAASLALENQSLATPDSIHSLPTSAGQEDLNANSTTAGRHLLSVIFNLNRIIALELITASQALDLRLQLMPRAKPGVGTAAVHQAIRKHVPFYTEDHPMEAEIEILARLVTSGTLIRTAAQALAYNTATSDYP